MRYSSFWLPLLVLNLTTKRSLHEFRELPNGASAIAHNPRKRGDGVLAVNTTEKAKRRAPHKRCSSF